MYSRRKPARTICYIVYFKTGSVVIVFVFLVCFYYYFVEEEENDLQNRSLTPYPFVCPEFWRHYNYLKAFHDWHTGAVYPQQEQQQQRPDVDSAAADDAYTAHVLNTIDEEGTVEDDKSWKTAAATDGKDDGNDAECEVTVTVTLPWTAKKTVTCRPAAAAEGEASPVDFWRQINDDEGREVSTTSTNSDDESTSSEDRATTPLGDAAAVVVATAVGRGKNDEKDVDSGISATVSADISRQTSEKDVQGRGQKTYKRTCTHSRLFDFLQDDDNDDDDDECRNDDIDKPPSSSATSGYSSAATTPSARAKYESDSGRTEYDSYYKSWEYACPYFGYDILPSKAFKAIVAQQQQLLHERRDDRDDFARSSSAAAAIKFKCPKIPAGEDES